MLKASFRLVCFANILTILGACATPPGKLVDSDFIAKSVIVPGLVPDAVSTFYEGLRYCGPHSGGVIFVIHHGVPDCAPMNPDGSVVCDLYIEGVYGGRSDFVLGRADFKPISGNTPKTAVDFRVQSYAANKERILESWELFLRGNADKVCPQ